MKLCSAPRMQPKILLALSFLSCSAVVALCFYLVSFGSSSLFPEIENSARWLRGLCLAGAAIFLLCGMVLLYLRCLLANRAQVVATLAERCALLELQQQNAPDDIMVVDGANTVVFHNRRHPDLWGDTPTASEPLPFLQAVEPLLQKVSDPEELLVQLRSLAGRPQAESHDEIHLLDGRVFYRYTAPLRAADGTLYGRIWCLRDSTADAQAIASLRESENTYRGVLESSADGVVVVDESHRIILVNEQFELMFGYPRAEVLGKDVDMLVPKSFTRHKGHVSDFFSAPRRRMMGHGLKLVALRRDGSEFPVEIGLSPIRTGEGLIVSAAIRDITQHELSDRKIAAAAAYARTLFESSPDPLLTMSPQGEISDVNEAMMALTGRSREALVGSFFAEHFTDPEKAREVRAKVFAEGSLRDYPLTLRSLSGQLSEVLYNAVVYRDEAGEVAGAFAAARDMTQRQAIEAELRELNRVLEERVAQRSEELLSRALEVVEGAGAVAATSRSLREMTNLAVRGAIDTSAALSHTTAALEQVRQTALESNKKSRHVSLAAQRSADVAQGGRTAVQGAVAGMIRIQSQVTGSVESIVRLSEQSRTIGEIIATVNDLAEQSNLLAVNAAIEASKAGEQGKGFAVVAREVKNLSEQSQAATAQVRSILDDIRRATDGAVLVSQHGKDSAAAGVEQAKKVGEAIRQMEESVDLSAQAALQIAASCQQQLVGLDQVARAMESIREASEQNVEGIKRLEKTLKRLEELGETLDLLSRALQW
ncbi:PAS domain S-box protein [Geomonas sp. RF6]|uniref:methyl-accepting chemotaxis protein n=1 Tax=Geomonas sp. RF6 TaxID=2897342 RepID=UPI001E45A8CE|nr:PAS domain S-box protein [Geomonas sp. RF6]UFS69584.1 PAS domain S-box protein [Geomonas sp. RF6]